MEICNVRADRIFTMHIGSFGTAQWVWSIEMEDFFFEGEMEELDLYMLVYC